MSIPLSGEQSVKPVVSLLLSFRVCPSSPNNAKDSDDPMIIISYIRLGGLYFSEEASKALSRVEAGDSKG